MLRRIAYLLAALVALAAFAPVAQADDQSVFDAWVRENNALAKLETALGKNLKTWSSSSGRKGGPALERITKIRALIARRTAAVNDEDASTSKGASARKNALANLRDYDAAMVKLRNAVRAGMDGDAGKADRYLAQYDALVARARKYEKRARDAFVATGVEI